MAVSRNDTASFLVDGVSAVAVHNGVARVEFMRLSMDGKPEAVVELAIPVAQLRFIIEAFAKVKA